jgi:hypothetical protein
MFDIFKTKPVDLTENEGFIARIHAASKVIGHREYMKLYKPMLLTEIEGDKHGEYIQYYVSKGKIYRIYGKD